MKIRLFAFAILLFTVACRKDDTIVPSTSTIVDVPKFDSIIGFYLLNEGNMGSNKASLDYYDYTTGIYHKNIFGERNPNIVQELGDVGNDLQIYGSKMYAVINCSNLVEVMDAATAEHIASISIPNCRYITFSEGSAYVSSYAGPIQFDQNFRLGYVAKIDTTTLQILDTCTVGYQPEEMVVCDGNLYVANSGGYRFPDYDNTISVVDLQTFTEVRKINVAINLHRMEIDRLGNIYVSSRGDYYDLSSAIYIIDNQSGDITKIPNLSCSEMTLCGDSLYVICSEWSYLTSSNTISYAVFDIVNRQIVSRNFVTDGSESQIEMPYGIAINPSTHDILIADVGSFVSPGRVFCYSPQGKLRWSVIAGDIPAHFAFRSKSNL